MSRSLMFVALMFLGLFFSNARAALPPQVNLAKFQAQLSQMSHDGPSAISTALAEQQLLNSEVLATDNVVTLELARRMIETIDDQNLDLRLREEILNFFYTYTNIATAPTLLEVVRHAIHGNDYFISMKAIAVASHQRGNGINVLPDYVDTLAAKLQQNKSQDLRLDSVLIGFLWPLALAERTGATAYSADEQTKIISLLTPLLPQAGALITLSYLTPWHPELRKTVARHIALRVTFNLHDDSTFLLTSFLSRTGFVELPISKTFETHLVSHIVSSLDKALDDDTTVDKLLELMVKTVSENNHGYVLDFLPEHQSAFKDLLRPILQSSLVDLLLGKVKASRAEIIYALRVAEHLEYTNAQLQSGLTFQAQSPDSIVSAYAQNISSCKAALGD